jgi:HAD superfamily hydrolase (TIGR01509 family)
MILRTAEFADLEFLIDLRNEPVNAGFSKRGVLTPEQVQQDYLLNSDKHVYVAVSEGRSIGYVILASLGDSSCELSVAIRPEVRGRGLGRSLVGAGTELGFDRFGARRVVANIYSANEASLRTFRTQGYTLEQSETEPWTFVRDRRTTAWAFDMDGVLVDTVGTLNAVYMAFLRDHGRTGFQAEFDELNGPKLSEIITLLKRRHALEPTEAQLHDDYVEKIMQASSEASLMPGTNALLEAIRAKGQRIALVSSAPRAVIEGVLTAHGLSFDEIVSGDDVTEAKPSPDIYRLAAQRLDADLMVVEDSDNGIASALAAGARVVAFRNPHQGAHFRVEDMAEVRHIVSGFRAFAGQVKLELVEHSVESERADRLWSERKETKRFDGPMLAYLDHERIGDQLIVRCFQSSYRFFAAGLIRPLSVSGITQDKRGLTLVGRRSGAVTEYVGEDELVPSGSLPDTDYSRQILTELAEEAGIQEGTVETLGLVHDIEHDVYDVACRIVVAELSPDGNEEYTHLRVVSDFSDTALIPTSNAIRVLARL